MVNKLVNFFKSNNVKILYVSNRPDKENETVIALEELILVFNHKTRVIYLSFFVGSSPIAVSLLSLGIQKLDFVSKVEVGDLFFYDKKINPVFGEKALEWFKDEIKTQILQEFQQEQEAMFILMTSKAYEC